MSCFGCMGNERLTWANAIWFELIKQLLHKNHWSDLCVLNFKMIKQLLQKSTGLIYENYTLLSAMCAGDSDLFLLSATQRIIISINSSSVNLTDISECINSQSFRDNRVGFPGCSGALLTRDTISKTTSGKSIL